MSQILKLKFSLNPTTLKLLVPSPEHNLSSVQLRLHSSPLVVVHHPSARGRRGRQRRLIRHHRRRRPPAPLAAGFSTPTTPTRRWHCRPPLFVDRARRTRRLLHPDHGVGTAPTGAPPTGPRRPPPDHADREDAPAALLTRQTRPRRRGDATADLVQSFSTSAAETAHTPASITSPTSDTPEGKKKTLHYYLYA